jgi:antitoxin component of MazEF toxin-antitoxin module
MTQLHEVAEKYRQMKKYHAKLTKWGLSLGVRIPKELVKKYKLKDNAEVIILPEEEGIRIMSA